ncbi:Signal transduction histidine kinase [Paraburkholderia fungorum]|uniref:histidine kinase n=1 Tax=Paraburkholderia fungorum TaxID=134537 RepID=A0A1H1JWR0_9BURK|nr:hybrid sensor histidine kinase/response regulator [Paraburkholderia fungorum]SDR54095.1 Signal transduction histidine kinase [Paraburkholderia fungorum]
MPFRKLSADPTAAAGTNRNSQFQRTRQAFFLALALTVVAPTLFLGLLGWQDWEGRLRAARDTTERSTYIAEEHAQKIFDINAALAERVLDTLSDQADAPSDRLRRDRPFYDYLNRLVQGYRQVDALSVWMANGLLGATSVVYPAPDLNIADRSDFKEAVAGTDQLYVSGPMKGRVTGRSTFNVMKRDVRPDGTFAGLVSISMSADYFEHFYRQLADEHPVTIGLIRSDGAVLAWSRNAGPRPERIARDTPFFKMLASGQEAGLVQMVSSVDGEEKILGFRRVGAYNVYASAGIPLASIRSAWLARFRTLAIATALPSSALFILILFSLRRLRVEERLWLHAEEESVKRAAAEAAAKESQRLEALGNMVALVAHDFNNLLMSILGYAHAASRAANAQHSDLLDRIVKTVQRGQTLTRKLLSVSRKLPVRPEKLTVADWSRNVDLLRSAVGVGIEIELTLQERLWECHVDQAELELALLNIAINARDAMNGRGQLSIHISNVDAQFDPATAPAQFVRIDLTDSGPGIDEATAARAFDPFFSTKPAGRSTGLGLAQVRSFCELSGGYSSIAAAPTAGTTVSLFLPRTDGQALQPLSKPAAAANTSTPDRPIRMLLVEDDETVADAQTAMFSALGYEVRHAATADEAYLLLVPPHPFQVVISDVQMPGKLNGVDLAEHLQTSQPELPLLMLTGFVDQAERLRALGLPAFLKPVIDLAAMDEWIRRRVGAISTTKRS